MSGKAHVTDYLIPDDWDDMQRLNNQDRFIPYFQSFQHENCPGLKLRFTPTPDYEADRRDVISIYVPEEFNEKPKWFGYDKEEYKHIGMLYNKHAKTSKYHDTMVTISEDIYKMPLFTNYTKDTPYKDRLYFAEWNGVVYGIDDMFEETYKTKPAHDLEFFKHFAEKLILLCRGTPRKQLILTAKPEVDPSLVDEANKFLTCFDEIIIRNGCHLVSRQKLAFVLEENALMYEAYLDFELPAFMPAKAEGRHMTDDEWRMFRWVSPGVNIVGACCYDIDNDPEINLRYYSCYDSAIGMLTLIALAMNDVFSYGKDETYKKVDFDNHVQRIQYDNKCSIPESIHLAARRNDKLMGLIHTLYEYSPPVKRPLIRQYAKVAVIYQAGTIRMRRYGWKPCDT